MKILRVLSSLDPAYGGPAATTRAIDRALTAAGHSVTTLSLDSPSAAATFQYAGALHGVGPGTGGYGFSTVLNQALEKHVPGNDVVIVNGLWQYYSYATWRAARKFKIPFVVYPHGMLDPWFKNKYPLKHLKKQLYWLFFERKVIRDAKMVIFTSSEEARVSQKSFWPFECQPKILPYGIASPEAELGEARELFFAAHPYLRGRRTLLFLGRIHEKKGCDLLIEAFGRSLGTKQDFSLVFAGPDQGGAIARLKGKRDFQRHAEHIHFIGPVHGSLKWGAYAAADVFCLPSFQENFGVAVAEALSCATPVIISTGVNIWADIRGDGAGLVHEPNVASLVEVLSSWSETSTSARNRFAEQAQRTYQSRYAIQPVVDGLSLALRGL